MVLSQEQRQGGCFTAVYSIPSTSPGWSQREKCHGWKRKQCHLLAGCMAGCVPDWSQDCTAAEHRDRATVAAAGAVGATVPQLLPSPQTESPDTCPAVTTTAPERSCTRTANTTGVSILAAQLLSQTNSLSRFWVVPCPSLTSGPGGEHWAVGASRCSAFVFLPVEWGATSGWTSFCLCLETALPTGIFSGECPLWVKLYLSLYILYY